MFLHFAGQEGYRPNMSDDEITQGWGWGGDKNDFAKELYFDTCNVGGEEYDLTNHPFIIADLTAPYYDVFRHYEP
jgi:hypothetical protein